MSWMLLTDRPPQLLSSHLAPLIVFKQHVMASFIKVGLVVKTTNADHSNLFNTCYRITHNCGLDRLAVISAQKNTKIHIFPYQCGSQTRPNYFKKLITKIAAKENKSLDILFRSLMVHFTLHKKLNFDPYIRDLTIDFLLKAIDTFLVWR